ncbi:ABC transporter ATP-binding protein [Ensifer sp. ENS06]|uniref:ABC transporter ATP-binding protein n=1 Tax=Ensifer sp. ENS06 TaxID=2769276 RepID=UPI00177B2BE1|nr:ABC transporter ATP-binding protein [Ensifer sp. ENS06]MBD9627072.1 ABC transporter ATP-binding protein [Ensifer sp. ENS06]
MSLLQLEGLSLSYGALKVTNDVTMSVEAGTALGIIGPNGAGKSTLLDLIMGSRRPDAGRVMLEGADITHVSAQERCDLGIARAFQIPRPFSGMTVFENILLGATHGGRYSESKGTSIAVDVLEVTGLSRLANASSGSLRLLDRKRLEMARALATRPRILLLDEVAGGLSDIECANFIETIRTIHRCGTTIIWIEHIVHALLAVVQRLFVLNQGARLAEGPPREVIELPSVRQVYLGVPA